MEDVANYADRLFVMNKGALVFQSSTKEVFAHYKELEQMHLAAPQVTYVMNALKEKGYPVSTDATTVEEAKKEILKLFR
jgi:energy-coupling factor transport system ATP-binding protein